MQLLSKDVYTKETYMLHKSQPVMRF
ncbi:unnamed protein product [Gulo gulo]|uniref:Uncharacterized protein n=1 Tax=Gulo gulo TaxID=48420 RepID=A0A9X9LFD5_GULGU|nr:unnamed protein product [Gulo gulo]